MFNKKMFHVMKLATHNAIQNDSKKEDQQAWLDGMKDALKATK